MCIIGFPRYSPCRDGFDSGLPYDKFGEVIGYDIAGNIGDPRYQNATPQKNGNISWLMYNMDGVTFPGGSSLVGYSFGYDKINRMNTADFGYWSGNAWITTNAYDEKGITYSRDGNIDTLFRYNQTGASNNHLKYYYQSGTKRLSSVIDLSAGKTYSYTYDSNGNVNSDTRDSIAYMIYDCDNLPVTIYKTNGSKQYYRYDLNGNRVLKMIYGGAGTYYYNNPGGSTEAVYLQANSSNITYNILNPGGDNIGQVKVLDNNSVGRYYYLKDHLGTVKMTVNGGQRLFSDIFTSGISQWTTVQGTGFYAYGGQLINDNTTSGDKILVSNSTISSRDFIINVNVNNVTSASDNASIIFRYQNTSNYYMVVPKNDTLSIYKCYNGILSKKAWGNIPAIQTGTWYGLRIEVKVGQISAYWNNSSLAVVSWTDPTPLAAGKVGCRKSTGYVVNWDNFYVWSDGNGSVLSYNDSYPFGLTMPNRSLSYSPVDGRYRFTGKERDVAETGYDYFGGRYYDSFIARWLQVDPLADKYPGLSSYNYCADNPLKYFDPDGKKIIVANAADRSAILKMINSKALGTFAFNKSGELYLVKATGDSKNYSTYYRDKLVTAINSKDIIEIEKKVNTTKPSLAADGKTIVKGGSGVSYDVDKQAGGGVTWGNSGANKTDQLVVISGNENINLKDTNGNQLVDKPADILAHEMVGHAIPHIVGSDTGNAVDNENKVRNQIGKNPQNRAAELTHHE